MKDTIAAISTALSDSGIGIIRISGEEAISIANELFVNHKYEKKLTSYASHTIHYGYIIDYSSHSSNLPIEDLVIDEVMVSIMKAPNSFTREDVVEINCHGGVFMVKKIFEQVIQAGAKIAEPGEFTKRAFLNGRIDLSKAEAVMDIIHAKSEFALKNSVKQLKGSLSDKIKELRKKIIYEIAYIESALDDPEHYDLTDYPEQLAEKIVLMEQEIKGYIDTYDHGKIWTEGIDTVIVGKPNAGKSSLLNTIVGTDRAIVTDIPGTTRDTIEENVMFQGFCLHMIDTAGIRHTQDKVEKIGVEKSIRFIDQADLILYVVDSSVPLSKEDDEIMEMIHDKKCLILLNKNDLSQVVKEEDIHNRFKDNHLEDGELHIISTSTLKDDGIQEFSDLLSEMFMRGWIQTNDEVVITNVRHKDALGVARKSLAQVLDSIHAGMPEDFFSIDLMNAYGSLGCIIGEEVGDDLVQEIFTKFCMGK